MINITKLNLESGFIMDKFRNKKKYGQNFLKNSSIVSKIVEISGVTKDDLVIEVGPGKGILTKELARNSKSVISYEVDKDLIDYLNKLRDSYSNVTFIYDDFLKRNLSNDITISGYNNIYFVSNIPYYITTPILMKIMEEKIEFSKIVIMVQKEVGERFSAKPNHKNYSSITVYLNYYYDITKELDVNRNEFIPSPNVDSCIVSLKRKKNRLALKDEKLFFQLVRDSFQFKRKNIKNNLRKYNLEIVERVLKRYGYELTSRAEQLPLNVFVEIANELCS